MPLLKLSTNLSDVSAADRRLLQSEGAAILAGEIGKSIDFVMVILEPERDIYFQGGAESPHAYLEIKNVGALSMETCDLICSRLCDLLKGTLSIDPSHCYVEFQESERRLWGWNGKTFAS